MPYTFDDDDTDRRVLQEQIDDLSDQLDTFPFHKGEQGRSYDSPEFVLFPPRGSGGKGRDGRNGKDGKDGAGIVSGQVDPISSTGFKEGDSFLNTVNGRWFKLISNVETGISEWVQQIETIFGDKGEQGEDGEKGEKGAGIVSGQVDPITVETGFIKGDQFLNTLNGALFEIVSNTQTGILEWELKIKSIFGDDGEQGEDGKDGHQYWYESAGETISESLGNIGDFFVTITNELLQKIEEIGTGIVSWGLIQEAFGAKGKDGKDGVGAVVKFNLGEISGDISVDLNTVSQDILSAIISGNTAISFDNIPNQLFLEFKIIIKNNDCTLSILGVPLNDTTKSGDVYIARITKLEEGVEPTVTFQAEEEQITFDVTIPRDVTAVSFGDSEIKIQWRQPSQGNAPILYDLAFSIGDGIDGVPDTNSTFLNDLESFDYLLEDLAHSTTHYIWVRAKNENSVSDWVKIISETDIPLTAAILELSIISPDFQSISGSWVNPENRNYRYSFSLTDPDGVIDQVRYQSLSENFERNRLKPNSNYSYEYTVHNEFGRVIFSQTGTVTTLSLPVPSLEVSVSGTTINCNVVIPSGIRKVRLEYGEDSTFGRKTEQNVGRSIRSNTSQPETVTVTLANKNTLTIYYLRVVSEFLDAISDYSETVNIETGSYLAPYSISSLRVNGLGNNRAKIKWKWGKTFRAEWVIMTFYIQGQSGSTLVNTVFRENDPKDLDERENRGEIIVENLPKGSLTFVATAQNHTDKANSTDTDSETIT